ncbi:hypothetical protein ABZ135_31195 [Streptomyces sp. NPDC006339]|uniref:hypothetical protein n=1 Tax=Streptomyces sp. NPDC006339 TaxID=3156755 RepID=UPI0033B6C151
MNTTTFVLAGAFENIGNGLFGLGESWAERALKLFLIAIVAITVIKKMSIKAGIGAVLGLAICLGIYSARTDLADAFKQELTDMQSAPAHPTSQHRDATAGRMA